MMKILRFVLILTITIVSSLPPLASTTSRDSSTSNWTSEFETLEAIYRESWDQPNRWDKVSPQGDGMIAAWIDGPYALQAYLVMYSATLNHIHLERFAQRAKQLLDLRWDANGDGMKGWPSAYYSNDLLTKGDFEDGGVAWGVPVVSNDLPDSRFMILGGLPSECSTYAGVSLGKYWGVILQGSSFNKIVATLPGRDRYYLSAAARIPPNSSLVVTVNTEQTEIQQSADRGPEGWQSIAIPYTIDSPSIDVRLETVGGNVEIDNVKVTSYEEMVVIDTSMAIVLAHYVTLEPDSPFAAEFKTAAEELTHKWDADYIEISADKAVYRAPDDNSYNIPLRTLPYNMMANAGLANLWLSDLDPQGGYLEKAIAIGNAIRAALRPNPKHPGGIIWSYRDALLPGEPAVSNNEDMSHAGITVKLVGELYRRGLVFSSDDVQKIIEALTLSWNGNTTSPEFTRYVGGLGTAALPEWGMFFKSHLELSPQLMEVVGVAYDHFWQQRECKVLAQTTNAGQDLLVPALMLQYTTQHTFLPLVMDLDDIP
jgi:hypothetical protein